MRNLIIFITVLMLCSCVNTDIPKVVVKTTYFTQAEKDSIKNIGKLLVDDLLNRTELMWYNSDVFNGFHYAEAVTVYGALQFSSQQKDQQRLSKLHNKYQQIPSYQSLASFHHVDGSVIGIVPMELYKTHKSAKYKLDGLWLADTQWDKPLANGMTSQSRYWVDDIYMINSLQIQAYRLTNNNVYLDRAALNTVNYLKKLQQENGLFWHGINAPHYWGRGNGWVAAGIAELLTELPSTHVNYAEIANRYKKMMASLLTMQAKNGLWNQLVDDPQSWQETSATAMFAWSMQIGIKQGILEQEKYKPAVINAWHGLKAQLTTEGKLRNICIGTGQSKDKNYYLNRPTTIGDLHGQAPLFWLISALLDA